MANKFTMSQTSQNKLHWQNSTEVNSTERQRESNGVSDPACSEETPRIENLPGFAGLSSSFYLFFHTLLSNGENAENILHKWKLARIRFGLEIRKHGRTVPAFNGTLLRNSLRWGQTVAHRQVLDIKSKDGHGSSPMEEDSRVLIFFAYRYEYYEQEGSRIKGYHRPKIIWPIPPKEKTAPS